MEAGCTLCTRCWHSQSIPAVRSTLHTTTWTVAQCTSARAWQHHHTKSRHKGGGLHNTALTQEDSNVVNVKRACVMNRHMGLCDCTTLPHS